MHALGLEIVKAMPGFISIKGYKGEDGEELNIVRFKSEEALEKWRTHPEHVKTQERGRKEFYRSCWIRVCRVVANTTSSGTGGEGAAP